MIVLMLYSNLMNKESPRKKFEKQIEIELKNAKSLEDSVKGLKNVLVRELLVSIASDSKKHASFYKALLQFLSAPSTAMTKEEYENLEKIVKEHVQIEAEMVEFIKKLLSEGMLDSRVEYLLRYILEDELRHHALLKGLLEAVVKREVITEDQWWDLVWKDAVFRGTPGG